MIRLLLRKTVIWFLKLKMLQTPMLGPFNIIYRSAESSSLLGIQNITHNTELWDGEHYVLSLSSHSSLLKTDTKILFSSFKHLAYFIKQHPLREHPIKQFSTILGVVFYIWNLF